MDDGTPTLNDFYPRSCEAPYPSDRWNVGSMLSSAYDHKARFGMSVIREIARGNCSI